MDTIPGKERHFQKRPRQVAESFNTNGWDVTVIHKDQKNENIDKDYSVSFEENGVKRISVRLNKDVSYINKYPLLRKIETLYYTTFYGDRTYKWATDVVNNFSSFNIAKPALIISFFTPRVPLYLGNYFSRKLGAPGLLIYKILFMRVSQANLLYFVAIG